MRSLQKDTGRLILKAVLFSAIAAIVIIADRIAKNLAVELLKPIENYPLWKGVFELTFCTNYGAAFSILSNQRWLLIAVTAVAMLFILVAGVIYRKASYWFFLSLGMICGGGAGNMIDRIAAGYVVDFFDFTLINFPVFNVADVFICVGAALLLIDVIFIEKEEVFSHKSKKAKESATDIVDNN